MRKITFTPDAFKEYNEWIKEDFEVVQKIQLLLRDIQQNAFKGLGKPEPLKVITPAIGAGGYRKRTG